MTTLTHKKLLLIDKDHKQAAQTARLYYALDTERGITRLQKGKTITYFYQNK